jgi:hypothetical protein
MEGNYNFPGPIKVLKEAIKAVPFVRYALGVAGIGAAVMITLGLLKDPKIAFFGIVIMLGLMSVLAVFSKVARNIPRILGLVLIWSVTLLFIGILVSLVTSFVFGVPATLATYLWGPSHLSVTPTPTATASPSPDLTIKNIPTTSPTVGASTKTTATPKTTPTLSTPTPVPSDYKVRLIIPSGMDTAQVLVNEAPATVVSRLPTFIIILVKPQSTNTIIRLVGKKKCNPIEQLIHGDANIWVDCQ